MLYVVCYMLYVICNMLYVMYIYIYIYTYIWHGARHGNILQHSANLQICRLLGAPSKRCIIIDISINIINIINIDI